MGKCLFLCEIMALMYDLDFCRLAIFLSGVCMFDCSLENKVIDRNFV